jgi:hypothetical protein
MQVIEECSVTHKINTLLTIYYFKLLVRQVIACRDELCLSNGQDGMTSATLPFPAAGHGSHA